MRVNSQQIIKKLFHPSNTLLFVLFVGYFFTSSIDLQAQKKQFVVVLDPGHGGKDPGTMGTKRYKSIYEKDIVLSVALKVGAILEKDADIKVVYTRKTDVFVELHKRGDIANKAGADLFISIHCNAASASAKGTETYVLGVHKNETNLAVAKRENDVILLEDNYEKHYSYNPNNPESIIALTLMQEEYLDQSIRMAKILEKSFTQVGGRQSKGVKQMGLIVLHQSAMPSILTEIGFLSNNTEEDFLRSEDGQEKITSSLVDAVKKYKTELQSTLDGTVQSGETIYVEPEKNETQSKEHSSEKQNTTNQNKTQQNSTKTNNSTKKGRVYEGIIFKVQIASSVKSIEEKSSNFKGLEGVKKVKVGDAYKYYYGNTSDYDEILKLRDKAIKKGYSDCFIVAFKGKERVSVNDVVGK